MNATRLAKLRQQVCKFRLQFAQHGADMMSSDLTLQTIERIVGGLPCGLA
jgi:hypothetical protein